MKKTLLTVLIILLIALLSFTLIKGWQIGPISVLGFRDIQTKDAELQSEINDLTKLASVDYENQLAEQDTNIDNLEEMKKQYQDLVSVNMEDGAEPTSQLEKYEMEYLWTQIGNHAKAEGIPMLKIDVSKSFDPKEVEQQAIQGESGEVITDGNTVTTTNTTSSNSTQNMVDSMSLEAAAVTSTSVGAESNDDGSYDLSFEATGPYVSVADFIYAIENDSTLGFKIEDFKMEEGAYIEKNGYVVGKFKCKGIRIKKVTRTTEEQQQDKNNETNGNADNNTTNNTTNTNTSNRTTNTNSTNKSNTSNTSN